MALAKEINENTAIVDEAVNAKKRMVAAEKKAAKEQEKTQTVRTEKKNIYNLLRYQRQQSSQLRQHIADLGDVDQLREEHESLWLEFDELRLNYDNLHAELEEKNAEIDQVRDAEQSIIETRGDDGEYTTAFRTVLYNVLGSNVPHDKVNDVIQNVLSFVGKEAASLPSLKTIRKMNIERLSIGQQHVAVGF